MQYKEAKYQKMSIRIFFTTLFTVLMFSCASRKQAVVAPITTEAGTEYHFGKIVWHDLLTNDVAAVQHFYGGLFGWTFERNAEDDSVYTLIRKSGRAIGGIIRIDEKNDINSSQWLSYISVDDVDAMVAKYKARDCEIYRKPFDLPDRGRVAVVIDPQGAAHVLIKSSTGDPEDRKAEPMEWLWTELLTQDDEAAVAFYRKMFGYSDEETEGFEGRAYHTLTKDDKPRAGVVEIKSDDIRPNWLPYVRVEDPYQIAEKVEALGGQLLLAPNTDIREGSVAVIIDPSGAGLAIQKWPY